MSQKADGGQRPNISLQQSFPFLNLCRLGLEGGGGGIRGGGVAQPTTILHCPTALRQELEELRERSRQLQEDGEQEDEAVPSAA